MSKIKMPADSESDESPLFVHSQGTALCPHMEKGRALSGVPFKSTHPIYDATALMV